MTEGEEGGLGCGACRPNPKYKKKEKKLETHHTIAAGAGTGASPWQRGGIGMWNLYTEPVSVKKELRLTTKPKEWQGQRIGEVCEGNAAKGDRMRQNKGKQLM